MTPGEPGPWRTPHEELERFRAALDGLQLRLQVTSRWDRYKPSEDLALVRIHLGSPVAGADVVGEILDLSADGMKIALAATHAVEVDQCCQLKVSAAGLDGYELMGTVRWVDRHPYITVFGLAFEAVPPAPES